MSIMVDLEVIMKMLTPILVIGIGGAFIIMPIVRNAFIHSQSNSVSKLNYEKTKEFSLD